jgi:uncharacterized Ntn-hydrolase superfamily protein
MERETVWPAMVRGIEAAEGDLAERMMAALEAAQAEGGDIRGRQSAALLVVSGTSTGRPWVDRLFDLRIEDHPEPLVELRRLLHLARAYREMNAGDEAMTVSEVDRAVAHYDGAATMVLGQRHPGVRGPRGRIALPARAGLGADRDGQC